MIWVTSPSEAGDLLLVNAKSITALFDILRNNLDCNAKQWRLFADVLNDCGIFVQLIVPMMPKVYFTPVMCLAGKLGFE